MKTLELTEDEQRLLGETLERSIRDLEMEVLHTDSHEFKAMLKQRKIVLDRVRTKLGCVEVDA